MISVHDMLENAFVAERVAVDQDFWIGFWRQGTSFEWAWIDDTTVDFTNWCDGEPPGDGQLFAWISYSSGDFCWKTTGTTGYTYAICKIPDAAASDFTAPQGASRINTTKNTED